jgi:hypothetical protein
MSDTKFTAGPWYTDTNKAGDYTQIKAQPNKFICECDGREKEYQNEANAKLISAAPDMYEAIKNYIQAIEAGEVTDQFDVLKAALKKATE